MADFDNGYSNVTTLEGREVFLLVDPLFRSGLNITVADFVAQYEVTGISDVPGLEADLADKQTAININSSKRSFDDVAVAKLSTIEEGADRTDQTNVYDALGISLTGSTDLFLTQRGTFEEGATGGGGTEVTKAVIDAAIGVAPDGDSAQFYNEQGNFVDAVYDSIEEAPIIRNKTIESIVISGTRSNVQARLTGVSEMSTITMQNTFDSSPTQYTTTFTSPNTTFTPALTFPAGSQGRQLSLTEADGTLHRFCYLVNGNYRHLGGGLSGTVRLGPVAVATTASVTAAVTVPDQTAGQTITLAGDETGTFSVGDFISPQANNFGAYRGIFVDSITFNGTNTVIVGPSNGATTFQTTSVLRNAGPATEIQGTIPTFSGTPDTGGLVYSSSIPATEFTVVGVNTSAHLIQVANAYAALETAITTDGVVTDNGNGTSSITVNYNTETNIDSSFTVTGGLNNMVSIVNVDGAEGELAPATTIQVIDPEATEVVSFTSSAALAGTNNVDEIAAQIALAVNNNIETPINFDAQYDAATTTLILTAEEAGNTNPWTIIFDNNGVTGVNAGNLGYTSSQTGEVINQIETLSVVGDMEVGERISHHGDSDTYIRFQQSNDIINISAGGNVIYTISNTSSFVDAPSAVLRGTNSLTLQSTDASNVILQGQPTRTTFNPGRLERDYIIYKQTSGEAYNFDASNDVTTINSDTINFVANTITGLPDTTVTKAAVDTAIGSGTLATDYYASDKTWRTLPTGATPTTVLGTADEIDVVTVTSTATVSLSSTITDAITANTSKTGITTAQATAITDNTAKTGITTAQASAITANTNKVSFPGLGTTSTTALAGDTRVINNTEIAKLGNLTVTSPIDLDNVGQLNQDNTWIGTNTNNGLAVFGSNTTLGSIQVAGRIVHQGDTDTYINFQNDNIDTVVGGVSFHKSVLGTGGIGRITVNDGFNDIDFRVNKLTTGTAFVIDVGADTTTIGTDVLTINSTTINGLPSKADALSISGQVLSLLDGTTSLSTVTLPSGGTATTVQGTSGQIGVNTVGNTATVSLDTAITSAITANTNKTGISTAQATAITNNTAKTGITTTQAANIVTNNAKTGITNAQATAITNNTAKVSNVDILPLTNTFTAQNTFSGTATFSNNASSIQVASIIAHQGDTDTFMQFADNSVTLRAGNISGFNLNTTRLFLNPVGVDLDFTVNGNGKEAFSYDAGTDTFDVNADNITGIASAETGTWAPTFNGGGTLGTVVANYSKSGSNVICICDARLAAGTATTTPVTLNANTLPFSPEHNADGTGGTWYTAVGNAGTGGQNSGVMSIAPSGVINFLDSSTNDTLRETALRGRLQFTLTYITDQ